MANFFLPIAVLGTSPLADFLSDKDMKKVVKKWLEPEKSFNSNLSLTGFVIKNQVFHSQLQTK